MVLEVLVGTMLPATTPARRKRTVHTPVLILSGDGIALEAFFGKTSLTRPFRHALGMVFPVLGACFFPTAVTVGIRTSEAPGSKCCRGFHGLGALRAGFGGFFVLAFACPTQTCIGGSGVVVQMGYTDGFVALDADALLGRGRDRLGGTFLATGAW